MNLPIKESYELKYNSNKLGLVSTNNNKIDYQIIAQISRKGKGIFTIISTSQSFNIYNIIKIKVIDNLNESNYKEFNYNEINYQSDNSASIELTKNTLSKEIYIQTIELYDGSKMNSYNGDLSTIINFDQIHSISPNYIFSNNNYEKISFDIKTKDSYFKNFYLVNKNIEIELKCKEKDNNLFSCNLDLVEFGFDYYINYYNDIVLHTLKYYLDDNKCQSFQTKINSIFTLISSSEINNINNLSI